MNTTRWTRWAHDHSVHSEEDSLEPRAGGLVWFKEGPASCKSKSPFYMKEKCASITRFTKF